MRFGEILKKLREEKGLSQAELGEIFSVSEAAIYFYEINKRPATYQLINRLARYFDVTPEYLLGYDDIDKTIFASRLKDLREKYFLTQNDLGGIINVPYYTIAKYEKAKKFPTLEGLYLIADYFDISIDYLLGRTDKKELVFNDDEKLQKLGERYFEVDKEFMQLGLTPKRVIEIIKALNDVGLIRST